MQSKEYLSRNESADYLTKRGYKTSPRTLNKLACIGGGPTYRRFGRLAIYTLSDLDAWAESRLSPPICNTSQLPRRRSEEPAAATAHPAKSGPA
jgi:hypothetical protein